MKYIVTVNGNKYEVEVEAEHSEVAVTNHKAASEVVIEPSTPTAPQNAEGEIISAPMPGKILAVKVSNGDTVKKGDVLFVLEAMKMENEIMAPRSGVISGVFVQKDTNVNPGDKLGAIK